jgi:gliding motility-associated-like protein
MADHIVGGHIEMQMLGRSVGKYKLVLKLYYNELNPTGDKPNYSEEVGLSQKSNNKSIQVFGLSKVKEVPFEYSNEYCAILNKLKFIEVTYERDVDLDPAIYKDPGGYYIYHDRCCRNSNINNIVGSNQTSMAFYTEFPPLTLDGKVFMNSTPSFSPLSGEYVCIRDPFIYNFSAVDIDGDSLAYQLATPLVGKSTPSVPKRLQSGPFSNVVWESGYSVNNMISGSPSLSIHPTTGVLSVTPEKLGLFVFSVICEEYRKINGKFVKLGITQRDFQLRIIDCPPVPIPDPKVEALEKPGLEPTICFGNKVTFQATQNSDWSYQWELNGNNIPNANFDTLTAKKPGVYNLIVSLKNQCAKARTSRKITLKLQKGAIKLDQPNQKICEGESVTIHSPLVGEKLDYQWYKNDMIPVSKSPDYTVTGGGAYFISILNTNQPDECPLVSDTITVKSFVKPNITISTLIKNNQFCKGELVNIDSNTDHNVPLKYKWYLDGIELSGENSQYLRTDKAGNYHLEVEDTEQCNGKSNLLSLESFDKPIVYIEPINPICDLNAGVIYLKGVPAGGIFSGNGIIESNTGQFDPKIALLGNHNINYTYTGMLECQNGKANINVVVASPFSFTFDEHIKNLSEGASVELIAPDVAGLSYIWSPDSTLSNPTKFKVIAKPRVSQTYELFIKTSDGCISSDTIRVNVESTILIPNIFTPNYDNFNDTWAIIGARSYPDIEVSIYNRWGEMIFYSKGYNVPFDGFYQGRELPSETYSYKIWVPSKKHFYQGSLLIAR